MAFEGLMERLENELAALECQHPKKEVRYRQASNDSLMYRLQCTRCGEVFGGWIPHDKVKNKDSVIPLNDTLQQNYRKSILELEKAINQRRLELIQPEETQSYKEYLNTPEWKEKRLLVLERCGYLCEGCRIRRATEVHHLTYRNIGNEFLFELKGLCVECHRRVHPDKVEP